MEATASAMFYASASGELDSVLRMVIYFLDLHWEYVNQKVTLWGFVFGFAFGSSE
jgi:hypothetical protein